MAVKISDLNYKKILKKYANNKSLYIIIIIGIVFMLLPPVGKEEQKGNKEMQALSSYSDEVRLGEILSRLSGVGEVSVMITYYGTTSYDVAYERNLSSATSEDEEERSEENTVVTWDGKPMIVGEVYPKAKGVIIIAEGAKNPEIKRAITEAATAALEVSPHRVCVLEGKEVKK